MDKIYVKVEVNLIINKDSDIDFDEVMSEMEYDFFDGTTKAEVLHTEIVNYEIIDAK